MFSKENIKCISKRNFILSRHEGILIPKWKIVISFLFSCVKNLCTILLII